MGKKRQVNSHTSSYVTEETEARIAKFVGFKDLETYRKVKEICLYGIPELVEAMDYNRISIEKAVEIARLPKKEQSCVMKSLFLNET